MGWGPGMAKNTQGLPVLITNHRYTMCTFSHTVPVPTETVPMVGTGIYVHLKWSHQGSVLCSECFKRNNRAWDLVAIVVVVSPAIAAASNISIPLPLH